MSRTPWYARFLATISVGLLFLSAGVFVADRTIPRDLELRQKLRFEVSEPFETVSAPWSDFAARQRYDLLEQARTLQPALPGRLTIIIQHRQPTLELRLRCSAGQEPGPAFSAFIHQYAIQRSTYENQCLADHAGNSEQKAPLPAATSPEERKFMEEWLAAELEKHQEVQDKLHEQMQIRHKLNSELQAMRKLIASDEVPADHAQFRYYIQEPLAQTIADDAQLKGLRKQMAQQQNGPALPDDPAPTDANAMTTDQLLQAIELRQDIIKLGIRKELWPAYRRRVEDAIAETEKLIRDNDAQEQALREMQTDIENRIDSLREKLTTMPAEIPAEPPAETPCNNGFQARLMPTLPNFTLIHVFSPLQYLVMAFMAGAGLAIGLLLPLQFRGPSAREPQSRADTASSRQAPPPFTVPEPEPRPATPAAEEPKAESNASPLGSAQPPTANWYPDYDEAAQKLFHYHQSHPDANVLLAALTPQDVCCRIAVNLAIALVRMDQQVLLVDSGSQADICAIFQLADQPGLAQWMQEQCSLNEVLQETNLPGLAVLAPGAETTAAAFDPTKFHTVAQQFDMVLIYHPTALQQSPKQADALIDQAQGIFCMTQAQPTAQNQQQARQTAEQNNLELVGIITCRE